MKRSTFYAVFVLVNILIGCSRSGDDRGLTRSDQTFITILDQQRDEAICISIDDSSLNWSYVRSNRFVSGSMKHDKSTAKLSDLVEELVQVDGENVRSNRLKVVIVSNEKALIGYVKSEFELAKLLVSKGAVLESEMKTLKSHGFYVKDSILYDLDFSLNPNDPGFARKSKKGDKKEK